MYIIDLRMTYHPFDKPGTGPTSSSLRRGISGQTRSACTSARRRAYSCRRSNRSLWIHRRRRVWPRKIDKSASARGQSCRRARVGRRAASVRLCAASLRRRRWAASRFFPPSTVDRSCPSYCSRPSCAKIRVRIAEIRADSERIRLADEPRAVRDTGTAGMRWHGHALPTMFARNVGGWSRRAPASGESSWHDFAFTFLFFPPRERRSRASERISSSLFRWTHGSLRTGSPRGTTLARRSPSSTSGHPAAKVDKMQALS